MRITAQRVAEMSSSAMHAGKGTVLFFQKMSQCMHDIGGVMPAVVYNFLPVIWQSKLVMIE
jgi:hypothetical protein